jgi:hypothetical protein
VDRRLVSNEAVGTAAGFLTKTVENTRQQMEDWLSVVEINSHPKLDLVPLPLGRASSILRRAFDSELDKYHYSGSCKRVGRCMRILIVCNRQWVGGIVLGSTFANVRCRDEVLGLTKYVRDSAKRGLRSPWASENSAYWRRLQRVVNHARTFIFPEFQGKGIGIKAHSLLLTKGVALWEQRYADRVAAFDTLCDDADSKLFVKNNWVHVGMTAGFQSDPHKRLSEKQNGHHNLRNNVGLRRGQRQWEVWVRVINKRALTL